MLVIGLYVSYRAVCIGLGTVGLYVRYRAIGTVGCCEFSLCCKH
jgi:hypothetical protein